MSNESAVVENVSFLFRSLYEFPHCFTYRNLHGFARFPGDSRAVVIINFRFCISFNYRNWFNLSQLIYLLVSVSVNVNSTTQWKLQYLCYTFGLVFITDRWTHSTVHRRGPSLSGCRCSYLEQFTSARHFCTFVACLLVTPQDSSLHHFPVP